MLFWIFKQCERKYGKHRQHKSDVEHRARIENAYQKGGLAEHGRRVGAPSDEGCGARDDEHERSTHDGGRKSGDRCIHERKHDRNYLARTPTEARPANQRGCRAEEHRHVKPAYRKKMRNPETRKIEADLIRKCGAVSGEKRGAQRSGILSDICPDLRGQGRSYG